MYKPEWLFHASICKSFTPLKGPTEPGSGQELPGEHDADFLGDGEKWNHPLFFSREGRTRGQEGLQTPARLPFSIVCSCHCRKAFWKFPGPPLTASFLLLGLALISPAQRLSSWGLTSVSLALCPGDHLPQPSLTCPLQVGMPVLSSLTLHYRALLPCLVPASCKETEGLDKHSETHFSHS